MENDKILRDDIQKVFQKKLTIDIAVDKLEIEDCGDTKTATLYLQSISDALNIADSINNEGFKFTQIAKEYKKIYANRVHNKRPLNVYLNDENIGDETRQREFKEGSIDNFLRTANTKSLAHYACGFVNIQKDGTIFIGVDDHGKVKGVKFDHGKRDNIRTQISRIMKYDIEPPLSTVHYSISFAPVRTIKGEDQDDMYVLEINFYAVDNLTQLYKVDGEVYEKLDACLSKPLDKKRIHFLEQEIRDKQKNVELQKKITKLIAEKDEKENEISSLEREKSKLVKENKKLMDKSKVCVIL
ncbi:schlafen-like protein 1 [Mytilus edulis]|uniref:schlafen-like protein 1 n=1 Tax=Mytilus edulis TaxID=6550 RepID=UPI0039EE8DEF